MARFLFVTALAAASLSLVGCVDPLDDQEGEVLGTATDATVAENGLSMNGLSMNGLSMNGLSMNGLSMNGLSMNGLSMNGAVMNLLSDPVSGDESRKILSYVVSCALPRGAEHAINLTINGDVYTFEGGIGLAPAWGGDTGSCDADCQSWVSGCILSRVNYAGDTIPISMRGDSAVLTSSYEELAAYPSMEATYFGDLFSNPPRLLACTAHGSTLIERVCGPSTEPCAVDVLGDCDDYFVSESDPGGDPIPRCGIPDTAEGFYPSCRDDGGIAHVGSVTVYRQCGNGVCDVTESSASCPQDCP